MGDAATAAGPDDRAGRDDLAAFVRREIAPGLQAVEADRLKAVALHRRLRLWALGGAAALLLVLWIAGASTVWLVLAAVLGAFAVFALPQIARAGHRRRMREALIGPLCRHLGGMEHRSGKDAGFETGRFRGAGLVPPHTSGRIDDLFVGRHRGTGFQMAEATLTARRGSGKNRSSQTVFRGLLFIVEVPEPFAGRVLIGRELGGVGNRLAAWFGGFSGMERVAFPDGPFEETFEVYSDTPATARELISAAFADTLVAIARAHAGSGIQAGFAEGVFLLSLPLRRNLFEPGSLFRSAFLPEPEMQALLDEMTIPHRLIDFLHGDRPARLV